MKRCNIVIIFLLLLSAASGCATLPETPKIQETSGNESETTVYEGIKLTSISEQRNNAIKGTQFIDKYTYRLRISGLVDRPVEFTYDQLLAYPNVSKIDRLNCVEGWSFIAKWTGVPVKTLFDEAGIKENATNVIFYSSDGYSTSLELDYLLEKNIILAYKINDITLPPERGFPLQLVAEDKYGYKYAKWVTDIEITDEPYRGYWERAGYSNKADVGGPAFGD
ncbi:MAG: molybdopterin-dependent oxidoreductase [Methanosarcinaceae archaeon]|nr:molybdopterin-dependent oxidoreductase [Methanosarcinaceae archaeon]